MSRGLSVPENNRARHGLIAAVVLLLPAALLGCVAGREAQSVGITEGNRARDFSLESLQGDKISLSDFRGTVVLINFWATWCEPCRAEVPGFEQVFRSHRDDGFVVLGINVEETREQVEPFVDSVDVTYPVLLDPGGEVSAVYRTLGLPMSLLLTPDGEIYVRHVGFLSEAALEDYLQKVMPGP